MPTAQSSPPSMGSTPIVLPDIPLRPIYAFSVPVYEMEGSPTEDRDRDNFKATRKLICAWADRLTLRDELLAWPPVHYPNSPNSLAIVTNVGCMPFGTFGADDSGSEVLATYSHAILTVTYRTPRLGDTQPDPANEMVRVSESLEPTLDTTTADYTKFRWGSADGEPLTAEAAPIRMWYGAAYTLSYQHLETLPEAIFTLMGMVNNSPFYTKLLGLQFLQGTLLYTNPVISTVKGLGGVTAFNLSLHFQFRLHWNEFWREGYGWSPIFIAGGARWYYAEEGNLGALLV